MIFIFVCYSADKEAKTGGTDIKEKSRMN